MKIQCVNKKFANKEIILNGKPVKFDVNAIADLPDGEELLKKYPSTLCDPTIKVEKKETKVVKLDNSELEGKLKEKDEEIAKLKALLNETPCSLKEEDVTIIYDMCKTSAKDLKENAESLGFKEEANNFTHKELVVFLTKQVLKDANT